MATDTQLHSKWLPLAHATWYVCAALAALVLLATIPVYYNRITQPIVADPYGLGQLNAPFRIFVDASDYIGSVTAFALGLLLFWRKPNDRMALYVSFFCLVTATTGIFLLSNVLTAYFGAPSTYMVWSNLQTPLWVLLFCIFPDGHFVPRGTRYLFIVSVIATVSYFVLPDWRDIFLSINVLAVFAGLYAQMYRYRRVSSHAQRQQTKWWLYGGVVGLILWGIALLIYKQPATDPLLNVTPLFLTIAILRSRLWDIDVIIRKTVTYTIVVAIWLLVYFGGVILAQQLFANITGLGNNEIITVVSTLVIAALFIPLRNRIQNAIDKRFYRKKYNAQLVLQKFSETVRDETDLEKLTAELVNVVQETMQPTNVSVWLKTESRRQRDE